MGTGWMLVMVHMCKVQGHFWHGTALQFLPQGPESTNAASPIPGLVGGAEKYTSTCYAPTQNHLLSSPWEDPGELSSSHFWLREFFSWLKGHWCAWMYYQSPAEWVKMFSEQEICHTSLKSSMDMSKQHNLLEAFFDSKSLSLNMVSLIRYSKGNESLEHCGPLYAIKSSAIPRWTHLECAITWPLDVL